MQQQHFGKKKKKNNKDQKKIYSKSALKAVERSQRHHSHIFTVKSFMAEVPIV